MRNNGRVRATFGQRFSFAFIRFMHDNRLLRCYVAPAKLLGELGLEPGSRVFEVGCGPGFYTMGAAEAVGTGGEVVAFDVNPFACRYVEDKVRQRSLENVRVENRNAADSGFDDESVDFAFVVGVPHVVGGQHNLMDELGRVIRPGGILAYRPSRGNLGGLVEAAAARGFRQDSAKKGFIIFRKI